MRKIEININKVILYLFPLVNYWGYSCIYTDLKIWKLLQFISIPLVFIYAAKELFFKKKTIVSRNVASVLFTVVLSIFMSFFVWKQDVVLGYRVTASFLSIIFYFFLLKANFSEKTINLFVVFYGVLWICIWVINIICAPIPVFGLSDADMVNDSRGVTRFFIQGDGFLYAMFFVFFNKWLSKRNGMYLALYVGIFIIIVLQVTRQTIAFSFLVAMYFFLKNYRYAFFCIAVVVLTFIVADFDLPKNSVVGKMIELSQSQYKDNSYGKRNIRVDEYEYFFTEYSPSALAVIFGNGLPHDESSYGRMYTKLRLSRKYFYSDVGYAGIYIMTGVLGLAVFLHLFIMVLKVRIADSAQLWAKMFVVYIFLCNTVSFVISTSIIPLATALYIINCNVEKQKRITR